MPINFKDIKNRLLNSLKSSEADLYQEELKTLHMIDRLGIKTVIKGITDFQNYNFIKLLNLSLAIKKEDSEIRNKMYLDNATIAAYICHTSNPYLLNDFGNKYFPQNNSKSLKVACYKNLKIQEFKDVKKDIDFFVVNEKKETYLNPFTERPAIIKMAKFTESSSLSTSNVFLRNKKENEHIDTVKIGSLNNIFKKDSEIIKSVGENLINKLKIDYILYHELAHASSNQLFAQKIDNNYRQYENEQQSDLCSIIKVIKENNLNLNDSLLLCNEIINFRIGTDPINSQFLLDSNLIGPNIHSTYFAIVAFKTILSENYDLITKTPDIEIPPFVRTIITTIDDNLFIEPFVNGLIGNDKDERYILIDDVFSKITNIEQLISEYEDGILVLENTEDNKNSDNKNSLRTNLLENEYFAMDIFLRSKLLEDSNFSKTLSITFGDILNNKFLKTYQEYKNEFKLADIQLTQDFDSAEFIEKRALVIESLKLSKSKKI